MKVCGLDVHKDSIFCSIYDGKTTSEVKIFDSTTRAIYEMGEHLMTERVKRVAMESTSIYWIPVWNILLEMGFELTLVNPFLIKQMPGRKSDVKDAQWIATLLHKNLIRGSVIPNSTIQELRFYTRKYMKLQQDKCKLLTKMDRIMIMANIRISSCVSKLTNKSVIMVIDALIKGETNPDNLMKLVYGNTKNKQSGKLREALTGYIMDHHRKALKWEKEIYDILERQTLECIKEMERICNKHYKDEMLLLQTLPGVSKISAICLIAETGADMSVFDNSGKLTGWAGLRPRNDESAGKFKSTATTKGNRFLRAILVQIAWAASRTKGSFFKEKFNRLCIRKNRKKALIAIARKMAVLIWNVLYDQEGYNPRKLIVYEPGKVQAKMNYHQKELERLEKLMQNYA